MKHLSLFNVQKKRKTFVAPKGEIERYYLGQGKTIRQIAEIYGKSHTTIQKWFNLYKIESRVPKNANQNGSNNHSWKGKDAKYNALHARVVRKRGRATRCEECGRMDDGVTYDWANLTGNYWDIDDFKMMCRSCHFKYDGMYKNFKNGGNRPNQNKRKLIDESNPTIRK